MQERRDIYPQVDGNPHRINIVRRDTDVVRVQRGGEQAEGELSVVGGSEGGMRSAIGI